MLFVFRSWGQTNTIKVVDYKSNESIPFAHVCFEELQGEQKYYFITDKDGRVEIPAAKEYILAVSFVGYKVQIDTIKGISDHVIKLYPKVFDLDQIVVTANFTPQKVDQSIYNVKVIDAREIEIKAATNLSDVMSQMVNVKLNHDPALGTSMRLKGLSGNNVKILVDGVPVIGRVGGNIDLSQLSLYNIDHIEIVEGPLSVIYGSNALAGAVNIITKENQYSKLNAKANAYYETVGTYNFDGGISSRIGKHSFSLSGGRNFFGGFSTRDKIYLENEDTTINNRYNEWKPKEQYNADFYYTLNNTRSKIKYQSSFMHERLQSKGSPLPSQYYTAFDNWFYSTRFTNRLEYVQDIGEKYKLNMLASHSYYLRRSLNYFNNLDLLETKLTDEDSTKFNAFVYRFLIGKSNEDDKINFITGVDVNYEIARGERIQANEQELGDYAIFSSLTYKVADKLIIQPGLRIAYNTKYSVPPVPSINLKWSALKDLTIRGSYARGYRAPSLKELYIYFKDINHDIRPNEDLKAEYGHNFDLSVALNTEKEHKLHYSQIELGLFYNKMHNIIYLARRQVDSSSDSMYQYINVLNYNTLGGQILFRYNFYPYMDFNVNLGGTGTYSSFDESNHELSDYKFSPDFGVDITNYIQKFKISTNFSYKYSGDSYLYEIDENDIISVVSLEGYHTMDFTLNKKMYSNRLTISLGVKNILDNTTIDVTGGGGSGTAHSGSNSRPVGYGRFFFTKLTYKVFK